MSSSCGWRSGSWCRLRRLRCLQLLSVASSPTCSHAHWASQPPPPSSFPPSTWTRQELKKIRAERPRISDQFADLKANLATVSHDEWSAIPEIGDYTIKHRNRKTESNSAVPDSVLGTWLGGLGRRGVGHPCALFEFAPHASSLTQVTTTTNSA